jgi:hypothetical protein
MHPGPREHQQDPLAGVRQLTESGPRQQGVSGGVLAEIDQRVEVPRELQQNGAAAAVRARFGEQFPGATRILRGRVQITELPGDCGA